MLLQDRKIIVTGGASGIGAATVRAYVSEGALVASLDVNDEAGQRLADELGKNAVYFHCDVANSDEINKTFREVVHRFGSLDVLAHVAAIERGGPVDEPDDMLFDRLFHVNVLGTCNTNLAAKSFMRERGGKIINFGSAAGLIGQPGSSYYAATKGAVMAWTRNIAQEWAPLGITANAVAPLIDTPMYQATRARLTPERLQALDMVFRMRVPLGGKPGEPDRDLAPVMVFLASDMSRFITGQVLPVDGGLVMLG